jgi:hypothetical protein
VPKTPSAKAIKRQVKDVQDSINAVRAEASGSPTKSPSPTKLFLTKESNTKGFAVWDVDGRVGDMENRFKTLSDMVHSTLDVKKAHDDALELAKNRGKFIIPIKVTVSVHSGCRDLSGLARSTWAAMIYLSCR